MLVLIAVIFVILLVIAVLVGLFAWFGASRRRKATSQRVKARYGPVSGHDE